jgi:uncharacterized membrane protein YozB (DUF420 family)
MMSISDLSTLNAILNITCFILLILGYKKIKAGDRDGHKRLMLSATGCSVLFLISYLTYHFFVGSVKFQGIGWERTLYFTVLISHTIVAAILVPFVLLTLYRALKGKFDLHKRIAQKTIVIWLYVSISGVLVYLMLYHIFVH